MASRWGLEVVRGVEPGRVFPIDGASSALGNRLNDAPGIDLGGQEGSSPRRMAARHALLEDSAAGLSLRDLASPGGTFVNRQRLLSDQSRVLQVGDVIQLGSVQLKVVSRSSDPPKAQPGLAPAQTSGLPRPFAAALGATCRTWDDFLTASARDWKGLRVELESGRLATFLHSIQRDDLRPLPSTSTPDERLDAWLGRLPTLRAAAPDLDVHPTVVRVRALPGGGVTRAKIVITSTGFRLLRSTITVEPPATAWLTVPNGFAGVPFATSETTEIALEINVPESLDAPRSGFLAIESNGGSRRVEVRVEPATRPALLAEPVATATSTGLGLSDFLERTRPALRLVLGAVGALALRLLIAAGDWLGRGGDSAPSLPGETFLGAALGGLAGALFAARRGARGDTPSATFAGAFAGVLIAAFLVAVCRSIEPTASRSAGALGINLLLWIFLGGAAVLASLAVVPFRASGQEGVRP